MTSGVHASEDRLEEFCLGTVPAEELEDLESHLLICPACRERLGETEVYVSTMRQAAAQVAADRLARRKRRREAFRRYFQPIPLAVAAGVAGLALIWGVGPGARHARTEQPVAVILELTRGGQASMRPHVPAHRPLRVTLDLAGLAALDSCRVVMVDATGDAVYETAARPEGGRVMLAVPARFNRGTYWIRVYNPAAPGTELREFGLELD